MRVQVNADGNFVVRPQPDDQYQGPGNVVVTIAATWAGGAVFAGGGCCSAAELAGLYKPVTTPGNPATNQLKQGVIHDTPASCLDRAGSPGLRGPTKYPAPAQLPATD